MKWLNKTCLVAVMAASALGLAGTAHADKKDIYWSIGISSPGAYGGYGYAPSPVYVAPQPVYVAPQPVYVEPQPVYVRPRRPRYAAPPPVYYGPPPVAYHPGYYRGPRDGHRGRRPRRDD